MTVLGDTDNAAVVGFVGPGGDSNVLKCIVKALSVVLAKSRGSGLGAVLGAGSKDVIMPNTLLLSMTEAHVHTVELSFYRVHSVSVETVEHRNVVDGKADHRARNSRSACLSEDDT